MDDVLSEFSTSYPEYEIVEKLGEGASRVAFRANKKGLKEPVVIKFFKETDHYKIKAMREKYGLEELFEREINAIKYLNHPNIIRIYHHGQVADTFFIEEEFMARGTLKDCLRTIEKREEMIQLAGSLSESNDAVNDFEKISVDGFYIDLEKYSVSKLNLSHAPPQREYIINAILDAANHIVKKKLLPIDLKPDNIFINSEGEVKLGDLEMIALGESSTTVGSRKYSAPEILEGGRETIRSIIYTIGKVISEIHGFDNDMFITDKADFDFVESLITQHLKFNINSINPEYIDEINDGNYLELRRLSLLLSKHPFLRPETIEYVSNMKTSFNPPRDNRHLGGRIFDQSVVANEDALNLLPNSPFRNYQRKSFVRESNLEDLTRIVESQKLSSNIKTNLQFFGYNALSDVVFTPLELKLYLTHLRHMSFNSEIGSPKKTLVSFYDSVVLGSDYPSIFVFESGDINKGLKLFAYGKNKSQLMEICEIYNNFDMPKNHFFEPNLFVKAAQQVIYGVKHD